MILAKFKIWTNCKLLNFNTLYKESVDFLKYISNE